MNWNAKKLGGHLAFWPRLGIVISVPTMAGIVILILQWNGNLTRPGNPQGVRSSPLRVALTAPTIFANDSKEAGQVLAILRSPPSVTLDGPVLCHLLHLFGEGPVAMYGLSSGHDVLRLLTNDDNAQNMIGSTKLLRTRTGVRYRLIPQSRPGQDGESHRDVTLAAFAEAGLPLTTRMVVGGESATLEQLLDDSVLTFGMDEGEIAWTAIAYSLYLPPAVQWQNRDGTTFSFDDLAMELEQRPLGQASCGGAHILMAMTVLLRVDEQIPVLSKSARLRLKTKLRSYVELAISRQSKDGAWTQGWHAVSTVRPAYEQSPLWKFVVTGHLLEWMEYLPQDLVPPREVFGNGAKWLCKSFGEVPPDFFSEKTFCPWTHSVSAIRNLVESGASSAISLSHRAEESSQPIRSSFERRTQ